MNHEEPLKKEKEKKSQSPADVPVTQLKQLSFYAKKKKRKKECRRSPKATTQHITNLIHKRKLAAARRPDAPGPRLEGEEPRRLKNDSNNVAFISMRPHKGEINHRRVKHRFLPPHSLNNSSLEDGSTALRTSHWVWRRTRRHGD